MVYKVGRLTVQSRVVLTGCRYDEFNGFLTEFFCTLGRAGIEQLYHAYRDAGLRQEDLEGSRYLRIRHILALRDAGRIDDDLRWVGTEST